MLSGVGSFLPRYMCVTDFFKIKVLSQHPFFISSYIDLNSLYPTLKEKKNPVKAARLPFECVPKCSCLTDFVLEMF